MTEMVETLAPETTLLPGLMQRPPELGRIRMGDKTERGLPVRLKTFRLTSHSKTTLEAAATLYGGQVQAWTDAPDEGMWELITERDELDVLIPSSLGVIKQSLELWQGGTCERRCDGTTEQISGQNCLCAAEGLEGPDRLCDIRTRLSLILPRVPGLGVWRLDTSGYVAATTLPSTITLLARLTPGQWIAAVLRAEQRSKKTRDGNGKVETHRFVVPVIDLPGTTIGEIVGGHRAETALLEEGEERPKPPTAAERAAERRAQLEAQAGGSNRSDSADVPASDGQTGNSTAAACAIASPRGEACQVSGPHEEHRNGVKRWPTPKQSQKAAGSAQAQEHGRAAVTAEPVEVEAAAGVVTAPAADLTNAAREVFGDDIAEGEFRGAIDPDLQAGLDLIPATHSKGGR